MGLICGCVLCVPVNANTFCCICLVGSVHSPGCRLVTKRMATTGEWRIQCLRLVHVLIGPAYFLSRLAQLHFQGQNRSRQSRTVHVFVQAEHEEALNLGLERMSGKGFRSLKYFPVRRGSDTNKNCNFVRIFCIPATSCLPCTKSASVLGF